MFPPVMRSRSLRLRGIPSTRTSSSPASGTGTGTSSSWSTSSGSPYSWTRHALMVSPSDSLIDRSPSVVPGLGPGGSRAPRGTPYAVDQTVDGVLEQVGQVRAGEERQHVVVLGPVGLVERGQRSVDGGRLGAGPVETRRPALIEDDDAEHGLGHPAQRRGEAGALEPGP